MKLSNLNALATAIDSGSLRNAARKLGVSQPALSKAIRELELELGTSLLVRSSKGVYPTAQGKVLNLHATAAMKELSQAAHHIRHLSGHMTGDLAVAAVPLAVMLLMPETLRTFGGEFPEVRLSISEELYMAQMHRLRKGEVDIAIGGLPDGLASGEFVTEPLLDTRMVVVAHPSSPYMRASSLHDLRDARWVYTGASTNEGYARQLFQAHGLPAPRVGAAVNSTLALLALIANCDMVGLLPTQIANSRLLQGFVTPLNLREKGLPLTVGLMVRKDVVVSPIMRHFMAHVHRAAHHVSNGGLPLQL